MNRRNVILALCAAAVLLAAGGLFASNMGFKLNYSLVTGGTGSGTNTIGLPFNRQIGIDNAEQLLNDVNTTGSPTGKAINVQRYNSVTDAIAVYSKAPADPAPFALDPAQGYYVKVSVPVSYIVVGSHNPGYTHTFLGSPTSSASGRNFYAVPYHTTRLNAEQLLDEINATGVPTGQITNIQRHNPLTDAIAVYSKAPADPTPFPLIPGEAYFVKVAGNTNVSYSPSHY